MSLGVVRVRDVGWGSPCRDPIHCVLGVGRDSFFFSLWHVQGAESLRLIGHRYLGRGLAEVRAFVSRFH